LKQKETTKLNKGDENLLQEMLDHAYLCVKCVKKFYGREEMIGKIEAYILSENSKPFFIYGESGSGKTSLIAITAYNVSYSN
jgi:hypothetical protein